MKRGFTLLELIIVIGILAILTTVLVVVLNPVEKLREARDIRRLSDFRAVEQALNLYLTLAPSRAASLNFAEPGTCVSGSNTFPAWRGSVPGLTADQQPFINPYAAPNNPTAPAVLTDPRSVTGGGWVPVDFTQAFETPPFPVLPVDPLNIIPPATPPPPPVD